MLPLLLATLAHAQSVHEPGAVLEEALVIQASGTGLDSLSGLVEDLIPLESLEVEDISESDENFLCDYAFAVSNTWIEIQISDSTIIPRPGELVLDIGLFVRVNDPNDKLIIDADSCLLDLYCPGYVDIFEVTAEMPITLSVVDDPVAGGRVLSAEIGETSIINGLDAGDIHLECAIDALDSILSIFGLGIYDLIIDLANDTLDSELDAIIADLEAELAPALAETRYEDSIEVSDGVFLDVLVEPSQVSITSDGMEIFIAGSLDADPAECIAEFDPVGSARTGGAAPTLASLPGSTQIAAQVGDDFMNQALYAVWRSGLICQDLDQDALGDTLPLDTTLLGLLGGEPYQELFEEPAPMIIRTLPRSVPTVNYLSGADITAEFRDLDLQFFAELDGRMTNALSVGLDTDIGVDLAFDGFSGDLSVELITGAITAEMTGDLLVQAEPADIAAQVAGVFEGLLEPLIQPLVGDSLAFALPAIEGLGLTELDAAPGDVAGEWLQASVAVGSVEYGMDSGLDTGLGGSGCDESGCDESGCDDSSCDSDSSCDTAMGGRTMAWLFALLIALRRRQSSRS